MSQVNDSLVASKLALLDRLDIPGLQRIAAVCHYGRSGSMLLGSFLDGHPDLIQLPMITGETMFNYWTTSTGQPLRERLMDYPAASGLFLMGAGESDLPPGAAVSPESYAAAVDALMLHLDDRLPRLPDDFGNFIRLIHVTYALATGRLPATPRPLLVWAMHYVNQDIARRLRAEFSSVRFIHSVRDPISAVDAWFERFTVLDIRAQMARPLAQRRMIDAAVVTWMHMLSWDQPHHDTAAITVGVRFEDLHLRTEGVMRALAAWLDLRFDPCLLESTWNRVPYVVEIRGARVCGADPANARRRQRNLGLVDLGLIYTLMHPNFVHWNYPRPGWTRLAALRMVVQVVCMVLPGRLERLNARLLLGPPGQPGAARPRHGLARIAWFCVGRRLRLLALLAVQATARWAGRCRLIDPLTNLEPGSASPPRDGWHETRE